MLYQNENPVADTFVEDWRAYAVANCSHREYGGPVKASCRGWERVIPNWETGDGGGAVICRFYVRLQGEDETVFVDV